MTMTPRVDERKEDLADEEEIQSAERSQESWNHLEETATYK